MANLSVTEVKKSEAHAEGFAVKTMADMGPTYFNPILGLTHRETFGNISNVMALINAILSSEKPIDLCGGPEQGLALLVQTVWTAAQYQSNLLDDLGATHG